MKKIIKADISKPAFFALLAIPILFIAYIYISKPTTYSDFDVASSNCSQVYLIRDDSPFYDIIKIEGDYRDYPIKDSDLFACSESDAESYVDYVDTLTFAIYATFALGIPYIIALVILGKKAFKKQ